VAISLVAVGAQVTTTGTGLTPVIPGGAQTNDLMINKITARGGGAHTATMPAGWAERAKANSAGDDAILVWWKIHDGSESDPSTTLDGNTGAGWSCAIIVYRGVDTSSPWDQTEVKSHTGGTQQTWTPDDITTLTDDAWALSLVMTYDDNALDFNTANGHTERMSGASYDSTTGSDWSSGLSDKPVATAGAAGMPTWNQSVNSPDFWVGISMALSPAVGGIIPQVMHHRKMMGVS